MKIFCAEFFTCVVRKCLVFEAPRSLVFGIPVFVAHWGYDDALTCAGVCESVAIEVNSHMVDSPEIAEENEVAFLQAASTDGFASAVLVDFCCVVVEGNAVKFFVNGHDVTGAVCAFFGVAAHFVAGSDPTLRKTFESCLFWGWLWCGLSLCRAASFSGGGLVA